MVNQKTLDLIAKYEGCKLVAYKDTGGVWTIGVGHTSDKYLKVTPGLKITKDKAYELLQIDVREAEASVNKLVKVPLNENQFGALVSFVFNLGEGQFAKSTLLRKLNMGNYDAAPSELNKWVYDNGKRLDGLVARRNAEGELWNTPVTVPVEVHIPGAPPSETKTADTPDVPKFSFWVFLLKLLGF